MIRFIYFTIECVFPRFYKMYWLGCIWLSNPVLYWFYSLNCTLNYSYFVWGQFRCLSLGFVTSLSLVVDERVHVWLRVTLAQVGIEHIPSIWHVHVTMLTRKPCGCVDVFCVMAVYRHQLCVSEHQSLNLCPDCRGTSFRNLPSTSSVSSRSR